MKNKKFMIFLNKIIFYVNFFKIIFSYVNFKIWINKLLDYILEMLKNVQ